MVSKIFLNKCLPIINESWVVSVDVNILILCKLLYKYSLQSELRHAWGWGRVVKCLLVQCWSSKCWEEAEAGRQMFLRLRGR